MNKKQLAISMTAQIVSFLVSLGVHARTRRRDRAGAAAGRRASPFCLPERAG